jgi:hypothetical protein
MERPEGVGRVVSGRSRSLLRGSDDIVVAEKSFIAAMFYNNGGVQLNS